MQQVGPRVVLCGVNVDPGSLGSPRVCISQAFPVPGAAGDGRSGGLEVGV